MTVPAIHHILIAMPTGKEAMARAFYGDLLGFTELPKPANLAARGGCWFQTGNLELYLGIDPAFAPATKAHVAFLVDDLAAVVSRLGAAGYTVVADESLPGFDRVYVDDPFGNRTELLQQT